MILLRHANIVFFKRCNGLAFVNRLSVYIQPGSIFSKKVIGALLPCSAVVELTNLDPAKCPLGASADFHEVRDVVSLTVREDRSRPFRILFDPGHSLEERIFGEQFAQ